MTQVRVLAKVKAIPKQLEAVQKILLSLLGPTRQEPGCIRYELWQNRDDPTDFNFVEEWESQEALNAHFKTVHFQAANAQLKGLTQSDPIIGFYQYL